MSTAASDLPSTSGKAAKSPLRFVTAASLFDGHDAAINIMRRLIQAQGAEVVHLGHNRSVDDIVRAAIQEDADGIAVSSYQGGHNEFFRYMVDRLKRVRRRAHTRVRRRRRHDHARGNRGIDGLRRRAHLSPARRHGDGARGHDRDLVERTEAQRVLRPAHAESATIDDDIGIAATVSRRSRKDCSTMRSSSACARSGGSRAGKVPVVGITGTGGAGKSSVTDEILNRFARELPGHAHRAAGRRPDAAAYRRRAAGRPHSHEFAALAARLHALDRHPPAAPRNQRDARRPDRSS